jgi:hypothetical protein
VKELAETYRRFAERECKDYSPAYYRLALEVSEDVEILEFVAQQPVAQPNLLFAAVQYFTGPTDMPLTAYSFRAFLHERGDEVASIMRTRRTQTNEVGRCAALLPVLPAGPLALLEVGASAGLCLLLDEYFYDYGIAQVGNPESPVHIHCQVADRLPVPARMPTIAWRAGLDVRPVDVRRDDDAAWLLACVWPDHPERRHRLEAAIALARGHPPPVMAGDLVSDLPRLVAKAPSDAQLVVFHSATMFYISDTQKRAFAAVLMETSHHRDVVWISYEGLGAIPELASIAPAGVERAVLVGKTVFRRGQREDSVLALAHPHGAELTWLNAKSA